jgi:formiminotetrahydrofolate cyclodeaminase
MSHPFDTNVSQFLDDLKSDAPTPGGGAVAGLMGALSAALAHMVTSLTVGKKAYAEVNDEFAALQAPLQEAIAEFGRLAQADMEVFDAVMGAWRLPRGTDDEKAARRKAIHETTVAAAAVPMDCVRAAGSLLPMIRRTAEAGNAHAVSDAGIAALLAGAGARAAAFNVRINAAALPEAEGSQIVDELETELSKTETEARAIEELTLARINA